MNSSQGRRVSGSDQFLEGGELENDSNQPDANQLSTMLDVMRSEVERLYQAWTRSWPVEGSGHQLHIVARSGSLVKNPEDPSYDHLISYLVTAVMITNLCNPALQHRVINRLLDDCGCGSQDDASRLSIAKDVICRLAQPTAVTADRMQTIKSQVAIVRSQLGQDINFGLSPKLEVLFDHQQPQTDPERLDVPGSANILQGLGILTLAEIAEWDNTILRLLRLTGHSEGDGEDTIGTVTPKTRLRVARLLDRVSGIVTTSMNKFSGEGDRAERVSGEATDGRLLSTLLRPFTVEGLGSLRQHETRIQREPGPVETVAAVAQEVRSVVSEFLRSLDDAPVASTLDADLSCLKEVRSLLDITQASIAHELGLSQAWLSQLENGVRKANSSGRGLTPKTILLRWILSKKDKILKVAETTGTQLSGDLLGVLRIELPAYGEKEAGYLEANRRPSQRQGKKGEGERDSRQKAIMERLASLDFTCLLEARTFLKMDTNTVARGARLSGATVTALESGRNSFNQVVKPSAGKRVNSRLKLFHWLQTNKETIIASAKNSKITLSDKLSHILEINLFEESDSGQS